MKILIIRFSSIGDLTQSLSIPGFIKSYVPQAEIHFVTRRDLAALVETHPQIHRVWVLDRRTGFGGLLRLARDLRAEKFSHIYDAHNNLRSFVIRRMAGAGRTLVRPMMRLKRFLLICFKINLFEKPFSGQRDLLKPLEKWGMKFRLPPPPQLFPPVAAQTARAALLPSAGEYIVLAPSAAHPLKRWPLEHWDELIRLNPARHFVVLAGPEDHFTEKLNIHPNVTNLSGRADLITSAAIIEKSRFTVSNDTGLVHFAEQLGRPAIALMGPAPFGFPSRPSTLILERKLWCRPCSKHGQGPCVNPNFHECLRAITPREVSAAMNRLLDEKP